jgi:hypothetical protein
VLCLQIIFGNVLILLILILVKKDIKLIIKDKNYVVNVKKDMILNY